MLREFEYNAGKISYHGRELQLLLLHKIPESLSIAGDALDHQQDSKAGVGEEEDVEGVVSSLHASAPDQGAILAISIIPATESKCEAVSLLWGSS
jgi:hypothetical protein